VWALNAACVSPSEKRTTGFSLVGPRHHCDGLDWGLVGMRPRGLSWIGRGARARGRAGGSGSRPFGTAHRRIQRLLGQSNWQGANARSQSRNIRSSAAPVWLLTIRRGARSKGSGGNVMGVAPWDPSVAHGHPGACGPCAWGWWVNLGRVRGKPRTTEADPSKERRKLRGSGSPLRMVSLNGSQGWDPPVCLGQGR